MQSIHQSAAVGVIWAISSFTEMFLLEFLPGWILHTSNQCVAAQGTADAPGGVAEMSPLKSSKKNTLNSWKKYQIL